MRPVNYDEMVLSLVNRIEQNSNKLDLHSFTGHTSNGFVAVESTGNNISIDFQANNDTKWTVWSGSVLEAVDRLIKLGLDLSTVRT